MNEPTFTQKDVDKLIGHGATLMDMGHRTMVKIKTSEGFKDRLMKLDIPQHLLEEIATEFNSEDSIAALQRIGSLPNGKKYASILTEFFKTEHRQTIAKEDQAKADLAKAQRKKELILQIDGLLKNGPYILSRNDATRMHQLMSHSPWLHHEMPAATEQDVERLKKKYMSFDSFLIQHDWAKVFHDAKTDGDDISIVLPFEHTAFEYVVNGMTIIHFMDGDSTSVRINGEKYLHLGIGYKDSWIVLGLTEKKFPKMFDYLNHLSDRVLLAMDSEIAVSDVVGAPTKLNKKRIESGKLPINEYRIVKIRPRKKQDSHAAAEYQGIRRLHVRRGHWRHYEKGTKTWIKSMLVGNPDLGFIDHDYKIGI